MQSTFGVIMLALVPDARTGSLVPKVMPLKEVLEHYIAHRHVVIVRRTQFDLDNRPVQIQVNVGAAGPRR
jgi:DNA gyrase subunit A